MTEFMPDTGVYVPTLAQLVRVQDLTSTINNRILGPDPMAGLGDAIQRYTFYGDTDTLHGVLKRSRRPYAASRIWWLVVRECEHVDAPYPFSFFISRPLN